MEINFQDHCTLDHIHLKKGFQSWNLIFFSFDSLTDLEEFIKVTDAGLQKEVNERDYNGLVEIMGHLLSVRDRQASTDELFEPLKETITLLESYGQKMSDQAYVQLEVL